MGDRRSVGQKTITPTTWSFFGASEQGPSRALWKGFCDRPNQEPAEVKVVDFFRHLLKEVYGDSTKDRYEHKVSLAQGLKSSRIVANVDGRGRIENETIMQSVGLFRR